jgi:cell division septation protein DedD
MTEMRRRASLYGLQVISKTPTRLMRMGRSRPRQMMQRRLQQDPGVTAPPARPALIGKPAATEIASTPPARIQRRLRGPGGREPMVRRADLGAKGVYYRTMVGPFVSAEQATELCSNLKAAGGSCIVQKN